MAHQYAHVGIRTDEDWPYGMSRNVEGQRSLVKWAETHRVRLSRARIPRIDQLRKVIGTQIHPPAATGSWLDHVTLWNRSGKAVVVVSQPYQLSAADLRSLAQLAEIDGVTVRVSGRGWYGHGTLFVEVWRTGELEARET